MLEVHRATSGSRGDSVQIDLAVMHPSTPLDFCAQARTDTITLRPRNDGEYVCMRTLGNLIPRLSAKCA